MDDAKSSPITTEHICEMLRELRQILNSVDPEHHSPKYESTCDRIQRLFHAGVLPEPIADLMHLIRKFRNRAEYDGLVPQGTQAVAVQSAWNAIKDWRLTSHRPMPATPTPYVEPPRHGGFQFTFPPTGRDDCDAVTQFGFTDRRQKQLLRIPIRNPCCDRSHRCRAHEFGRNIRVNDVHAKPLLRRNPEVRASGRAAGAPARHRQGTRSTRG